MISRWCVGIWMAGVRLVRIRHLVGGEEVPVD
jgi:hypothetical protein